MRKAFDEIQAAIAECLVKDKSVQAGYVFGSVVTGRTRAGSDVDVAVLVTDDFPPSRRFAKRLKLMADVGAALRRSDVDLVILNEASPLLAHRVLSKGKLVFERSGSARVRFQVMTAQRYADMIPAYELYIRYLKAGVKEGRIVG
jgi:predicted nucleotidyltransferase